MKRNWLILLLLALIIFIPPIATGYLQITLAEQAQTDDLRALHDTTAARLLPWRPDLYERAGLAYASSGNFPQAIALLTRARQKGALTPNGQFTLGEAYFQSGATEKALSEWESLLNEGQETARVSPRLAAEYHTRGQYDAEERVLRQWLIFNPVDLDASGRLGLLLSASASPTALPLLEQAATAAPEAASRYRDLIAALKTTGAPPAYQLTLAGQALANLGEWTLARTAFERATRTDATYAPAWAWLGTAFQATKASGAHPALEKAVALDASSAPIRGMYGYYLESQGQLTEAEAQYQKATVLEPQNPAWWVALARILSRRDLTAALANYQHAIELDPKNADSWFALAAFCVENDAYIQDYGLDAALRAYSLAPQNPQYMDMLGRALVASGETLSAEAMFEKAIAAAPQSAAPKFHLALLYLQTNRSTQSQALLTETQQLDPNGPYGTQAQKVLARYFP